MIGFSTCYIVSCTVTIVTIHVILFILQWFEEDHLKEDVRECDHDISLAILMLCGHILLCISISYPQYTQLKHA